jgi:hopene-associated glycosyltransferase HpnB
MMPLLIIWLSCGAWIYLFVARGGFWRAAERDDATLALPRRFDRWPRVVAVVPARNEADVIGENIGSLLRQSYPGNLSIVVVDDDSSDDTAAIAQDVALNYGAANRVTVLAAPRLPPGWSGKLWAVNHGVTYAQSLPEPPDYLLLTDADIGFANDTVTQLVLRALRDNLVLTSLMARLNCESIAERALIPAFVFFFQMLYPFTWIRLVERPTAAAAGGCMLAHLKSLEAAGGLAAIRNEIIDDCALAGLLKKRGPIWLGLTRRVSSLRVYHNVAEIRRMVSRSAYAQLHYSPWILACTVAAMALTYLAPPAFALFGDGVPRVLGALAWASMMLAFQPTLRVYNASALWGLALPLIAAAYLAFTLDSAWQHVRGKGGLWKGRTHMRLSKGQ